MFAKYDGEKKGGLSGRGVRAMRNGQRCTAGFYGWAATGLECEWELLPLLFFFASEASLASSVSSQGRS